MAAGTLVASDMEAGLNLIRALDAADFGVAAAFWLYNSDFDKWRMIIGYSGPKEDLEKKGLEAAVISAEWRNANPSLPILDLIRVRVTSADDKLISGLKPMIKVDGLQEVRFSHRLVDGVYVEDAIIHRMAA